MKRTALTALVLLALPSCLARGGVVTAPGHHASLSAEDAERCSLPGGDPRRLATCPPPPPEPRRLTVCNAEEAPEWSAASAAEKRDLVRRCHPLGPAEPARVEAPPAFLQL